MITRQDIDKLANLSRISFTEEEKAGLEKDLTAILGYVAELEKVIVDVSPEQELAHSKLINVFREDIAPHESGIYSKAVLDNAPCRQGDFIAVKAILESKNNAN